MQTLHATPIYKTKSQLTNSIRSSNALSYNLLSLDDFLIVLGASIARMSLADSCLRTAGTKNKSIL